MSRERLNVRLGDICEFRAGSVFKPEYQGRRAGAYPFVKVSDMNLPDNAVRIQAAKNWVTESDARALKAKPLPPGTVAFAKIGEALRQNRLRQVVRETIVDNNMMGAIPNRERVDPNFFYYALAQFDFAEIAQGTALPYLTVGALSNLKLTLPSIPEQRLIARVLSSLDDKIELNRKMNETLEAMARALFKSWFVDFDPVRAKAAGRSPSSMDAETAKLFPSEFVDSPLGPIPKDWAVGSIDDLAEIAGGSTPSTQEPQFWEPPEHYWATPKDLSDLATPAILGTARRISSLGLKQIGSGLQPRGTVLLSSRAPIGYLGISEVPLAVNQGFIAMRPRAEGLRHFLLRWAASAKDAILSRANGSTFLEISKSNFRTIQLVKPPLPIAAAFEKIADVLYARLVNAEHESKGLEMLRNELLPRLLSGLVGVDALAEGGVHP
jgi:type I restriction enzyme S subunit